MLMVFLLQAEYEEKIERVKNGARDCLSKVEIVDFPWPQALVVSIPPCTALPVLEIPPAVASSAGRCPGELECAALDTQSARGEGDGSSTFPTPVRGSSCLKFKMMVLSIVGFL